MTPYPADYHAAMQHARHERNLLDPDWRERHAAEDEDAQERRDDERRDER